MSIKLPFEAATHAVLRRRPEAHQLPLLLHPQARVREGVRRVRAPPRRLRHPRRGVRAAHAAPDRQGATRRRSCCSTFPAARTGRRGRRSSTEELVEHRLHPADDLALLCTTDDIDDAVDEIIGFYANYHSLRFVDGRLVLRMPRRADAGRARGAERRVRRHRRARRDRDDRRDAGRDRRRRPRRPRRASRSGSTAGAGRACGADRPPQRPSRPRCDSVGSSSPPSALMARSIARRACSTRFSSASASASPSSAAGPEPLVGEVAQLLLDRPQTARRSARCQPRRLLLEGVGEQLGRVADVEPGRAEVHRAPGVGRDHERVGALTGAGGSPRPCAAGSRVDSSGSSAAYAPPAPQHRPSSAVSRRRYAGASTVRTAPCAFCTWRRWHGSCTTTSRPVSRSASGGCAASHSEKSRTRAENARGLGRAEQAAVVLHRRAAAGAVDDDRRVARHRRDRPGGRAAAPARRTSRVDVQRAAAVAAAAREPGLRAGRAHDVERGAVHVALPRVHHAPGEQVARRDARSPARRRRAAIAARASAAPNRRGTRCRRCASQSGPA